MSDDGDLLASGVISNGLEGFMAWWSLACPQNYSRLVLEDFVVRPQFVGRPIPSEIIGAAVALTHARVVRHMPSMKATLVRGTEAQRFAWLRGHGFSGESHELDAITHALLDLRAKSPEVVRRYWGAL